MFKEVAIYYKYTLNKANYINKLAHHVPSASNQENKNNIYIYICIYTYIYIYINNIIYNNVKCQLLNVIFN